MASTSRARSITLARRPRESLSCLAKFTFSSSQNQHGKDHPARKENDFSEHDQATISTLSRYNVPQTFSEEELEGLRKPAINLTESHSCPGWMECSSVISAHCNLCLRFKQFSCLSLPNTGFHDVDQVGLEFLTSGDPPTLASQSAGIQASATEPSL
ncbi:Zinc finger protein [Plecturocebus cupreus]